jgi:hypothetical protein
MQATTLRAAVLGPALALVLAPIACGQLTGLSDDYVYDLEGGAADARARADASADADAAPDAAPACSSAQVATAAQRLSQLSGLAACKTCLAAACCTEVEACSATACKDPLKCNLQCTNEAPASRAQCIASCSSSSAFTTTLGACSTAACASTCGF